MSDEIKTIESFRVVFSEDNPYRYMEYVFEANSIFFTDEDENIEIEIPYDTIIVMDEKDIPFSVNKETITKFYNDCIELKKILN